MNENLGYSAGGAISAEGAFTPFHGCTATWGARHDVSLPITPKIPPSAYAADKKNAQHPHKSAHSYH